MLNIKDYLDFLEAQGVDGEKINWLIKLGAAPVPPKTVCYVKSPVGRGNMFYSAEYLRDTPLEVLKAEYSQYVPKRKGKEKLEISVDVDMVEVDSLIEKVSQVTKMLKEAELLMDNLTRSAAAGLQVNT